MEEAREVYETSKFSSFILFNFNFWCVVLLCCLYLVFIAEFEGHREQTERRICETNWSENPCPLQEYIFWWLLQIVSVEKNHMFSLVYQGDFELNITCELVCAKSWFWTTPMVLTNH